MEFGIEKCAMLINEKRETTPDWRNRITRPRKNIRLVGEQETYKYWLRIQVEMKEKKLQNSISREWRNYRKPNYIAEISSKGWTPGLSPLWHIQVYCWSGLGKNFNKWTGERENSWRCIRPKITRKQKWEEKQLYGHFKPQTSRISHEKTWAWLRNGKQRHKA